MLIFARTASRSSELAVRTALGASRTRVISQLFTEALVLAVLAAGMGLFIADQILLVSLDWFLKTEPYWIDYGVTRETGLWALALAGFSAAAMSIVPALKVTGKAVQRSIQRARAGRSGVRFGGTSGALIVANVALSVVTVGVGVFVSSGLTGFRDDTGGLPEEFLSAELTIPRIALEPVPTPFDLPEYRARVVAIQQELVRRLEAAPDIRGVAVGNVLPGVDYPARDIEVEGESRADDARGHMVRTARVDPGFFDALEQPILSGRGFDSGDLGEGSSAVIVTRTFVERVLDGRNPIGRRLRYTSRRDEEAGPWYEIVGLVGDLGTDGTLNLGDYGLARTQGGVYHPFAGESRLLHLAVHVGEDPESYTSRLRALVGEFDPSFIISEPLALHDVVAESEVETRAVIWGTGALIGILIALSISGIYALMSFTVTERRREIGIRVALGAQRSRVMLTGARRSLAQLGIGILLGAPFAWRIVATTDAYMGHLATRSPLVLTLLLASGMMVLIGALACGAPTLRALRIVPTEALEDV
jgi:predicted permease